jgi:hypothetical protein
MENNTQLFQLNIVCRNCKNGAHESCVKLQKQDFVTIKCICTCYMKKNNAADGFLEPESATPSQLSSVVTNGNDK